MKKEILQTFSYRISNASRSELVVVLYDIFLSYLEDVSDCLKQDNYNNSTENVDMFDQSVKKCGQVIDLLIKGLDFNYDISGNLYQIYIYIKRQLIRLNVKRDYLMAIGIGDIIKKLRNSFYEISKNDESGPLMKNTQQVISGLTYSSRGLVNDVTSGNLKSRGFTV